MGWLRDALGRWGAGGAPAPAPVAPAASVDWMALGNAAVGAGNFEEAARCYRQGVEADPASGTLRLNLGFVLLEQGRHAEAAERLEQAVALRRPADGYLPDAHFLLGRAQAAQDLLEPAFLSLEQAVRLKPDFVEAVEEGARVLHRMERHAEAAEWARRLRTLQPGPFTDLLLANELLLSQQAGEALVLLDEVCAAQPENPEACVLRYQAFLKLRRDEEALAEADRAIALVGRNAAVLVNRSVPLERMGRFDEAVACLDEALALEPGRRDAMLNRVSVLLQQVRVREAVAAAEEALERLPEDADLHWSLCLGLLLLGDYARGWKESEWRTRSVAFRNKILHLAQPQWQGESLQGRTIFLHAEQGFGDAIQFVRFVPQVASRAAQVLLLVPGALESLVAATLPANCRILPQHSALPAIDFHCPIMSLPSVLGTTLENLPAQVPYLRPDGARVAHWRERLGTDRLNVGMAWAGNPRHVNDHNRSMSLATFRAADAPGCRFVTVQPEVRDTDREVLADWAGATDLGRELGDFADTAAFVQALDLVITVDTSIAHLAGALGKPVWILLPHCPDWRWLLERSDSPWYPSARLYRQPVAGDWASVLRQVRADLLPLAQARRGAG